MQGEKIYYFINFKNVKYVYHISHKLEIILFFENLKMILYLLSESAESSGEITTTVSGHPRSVFYVFSL